MTSIKTMKLKTLAALQYAIGSGLYFSGVAGWHKTIHTFAMKQVQRASHKGHLNAGALMAKLLTYRGETPLDKRAGVALLEESAKQGDVQSQFLFAEALLRADVITPANSEKTALHWYLQAAKRGHAMAALRLSKAYGAGHLGLEKDEQQAQYWSKQFMQHSQNMSSPS
ncbi:MAG: TPR repeat protein [Oceanicoccus sp.]|jgi:TPR repeat protein